MLNKSSITIILVTCLSAVVLSGCASITTGTSQNVSVKTGNIHGATCSLQNGKGKWYVNSTPGSVTINRSFSDLYVECKRRGHGRGSKHVASHTRPMAFGNILFGGAIGAVVDVADGAAYLYPTEIEVPLSKA